MFLCRPSPPRLTIISSGSCASSVMLLAPGTLPSSTCLPPVPRPAVCRVSHAKASQKRRCHCSHHPASLSNTVVPYRYSGNIGRSMTSGDCLGIFRTRVIATPTPEACLALAMLTNPFEGADPRRSPLADFAIWIEVSLAVSGPLIRGLRFWEFGILRKGDSWIRGFWAFGDSYSRFSELGILGIRDFGFGDSGTFPWELRLTSVRDFVELG